MKVQTVGFFAALPNAHKVPPAPCVQVGKAFTQFLAERFFRMLLAVVCERNKIIPTVQIGFAAKTLFTLPSVAVHAVNVFVDVLFQIGEIGEAIFQVRQDKFPQFFIAHIAFQTVRIQHIKNIVNFRPFALRAFRGFRVRGCPCYVMAAVAVYSVKFVLKRAIVAVIGL